MSNPDDYQRGLLDGEAIATSLVNTFIGGGQYRALALANIRTLVDARLVEHRRSKEAEKIRQDKQSAGDRRDWDALERLDQELTEGTDSSSERATDDPGSLESHAR